MNIVFVIYFLAEKALMPERRRSDRLKVSSTSADNYVFMALLVKNVFILFISTFVFDLF